MKSPARSRNPQSCQLVVGLGNSWISFLETAGFLQNLDYDLGNEQYLEIIVIFPW